ncbi:hypothetical protein ISP17_11440 [Dyella ginsengisoli]|uniref:Uncharacterized protein n=1 Tax=Dyella ginsengisoli TaxID=363848 RepID=A0ABW8JY36_9GAMM
MFVAFIIVAIVSAYLALSSKPKVQTPQPEKGTVPSVKDGKKIIRVFGTVWIDDPMQLAMQQTGTDPIRTKGGKK